MVLFAILGLLWRPVGRPLTRVGDKLLVGLLGSAGELVSGRRQVGGSGLRRWLTIAAVWAGQFVVGCLPFAVVWPFTELVELLDGGPLAAEVGLRALIALFFLWLLASFLWVWYAARRDIFEPELFQEEGSGGQQWNKLRERLPS